MKAHVPGEAPLPAPLLRLGPYMLVHQLAASPGSSHVSFVAERESTTSVREDVMVEQNGSQPLMLVRIYPTPLLQANHRDRTSLERYVLVQRLATDRGCPHIVRFVDTQLTDRADLVIVEEYCEGGDLFELLESYNREHHEKRAAASLHGRSLSEDKIMGLPLKIARRLASEILTAVDCLHRTLRVCHRDIKLEHVFLDEKNSVRLGGFGMAVPVTDVMESRIESSSDVVAEAHADDVEALLTVMCGSRHYAAPEIVQSLPYKGCAADMWSVGICVFALLTGSFPFQGPELSSFSNNNGSRSSGGVDPVRTLLQANPAFARIESKDGKDFVLKLLMLEPALRMTAAQALRHPFLSRAPKINTARAK
jgi:serine/threonine protein kinase